VSEKIVHRAADGTVVGVEVHVSPRRPTKQSSNHHLDPTDPGVIRALSSEGYAATAVAEYGIYVAAQTIYYNGARAYNAGDPVPVSNVEQHGYLERGLVRRVDEPAPEVDATTPLAVRLTVRCRQAQLLGVYGVDDPPILLGFFAADVLRLQGTDVVAPRPVHLLAWLQSGRDAADFVETVIADPAIPLQLWCPNHKAGHDIDPAQLRAEIADADRAHSSGPWCAVERVEAKG